MYQMTPQDMETVIQTAVYEARSVARKCGLDDGHYEDMIQEALERVVRYAPRFNPERGLKFKTYAHVHVRGAIADHKRNMDLMSRGARAQIRENGFAEIGGEILLDAKQVTIDKAYHVATHMIDSIVPHLKFEILDDKEIVTIVLFLDGYAQREIGDAIAVTESRANQIIKKACDKLKRAAEGKRVEIQGRDRSARAVKESERFVQESVRQACRKYGSNYYR